MQPECKNIDLPTCGICSTKLNFNLLLEKKVQEHPHLKILICQNCFENFNMTDNDILCAWCKISEETTVKCIKCSAAFCKKCLEQNFDEDKLKVILRKKQWLCFTCDPVPLRKRRDSCKKVLNWLSKTEFPSKNVNKKFHNNKSINNIDESLPEIRKALIEKCSQLSEIGFQLITRSNSHMTVFKLQDINLPNILEALNYESQLMLSVAELCKIFIAEIDTMKEQLENLNEDVSQEPEVISGTSNALSYGKKDNKTRKRKRQNKLSLLANTAMTSEASDTEENMDIDEEQQLSKPEVLSNGTAKLNKSDNGDSNSGKLSLFSQETVDLNMHKEALDCSDEKVDSYNSKPPTDGELLLNGKSDVIINEGSEKSPASATLLPNATEASIIQDEKSSSVDDIGKNSISEERQDTTANNCSDDKLRYDQETEEDVLTPDSPDASKTSKTNFLFALGLCSTKEIDDRYVEMFKQYDDVDTSESDEEVNEMLSEKSSAYSTPDELRDVGHISRSLPNLPSDDEQNDLHTENSEATKNLSFPPCQIVLNKLDNTIASYLNEYNADQDESSQLSDDQENQEVDRLANLNSIGVNGKKRTHSTEEVVKSGLKKSKVNNKDSDSDSTMSLTHLLDDNNENNKTDLPLDEHNSEMDVVEYDCIEPMEVQEQISPPVSDSDFDSDLIKDSDEENESKSKKTRKLKEGENKENENKENEPLKEEVDVKPIKAAKPKWRNDPLLKGRITEDTDSDDDKSVNSKDQVRKKRKKHEHPIENHNIHATSSKESASEEEYVSNLIFLSSDSDSSIEFVKEFKNKNSKRPPISLNFSTDDESDSEEEVSLSMSKGRKNIRSICSDAELSILTKKAMDAEKSRRERVNEKQKLMTKVTNTKSLVLDVDEVTATPTITVHPTLYKRLKDHQRHGVQFMYNCCYENVNNGKKNEGTGCILAHSMGLGKTYQVVTLIHTLFAHEATNTKRVLIVCPLSVVFNWKDEFREAFKSVNDDKTINVFYISDKCDLHKRIEMIKKWRRKTGILIMGYEAYQKLSLPKEKTFDAQVSKLIRNALVNPGPDLVILDEGHLLKNGKIARTRALMEIKTKRRIILTGTPLQNNLKEYYYMVNFVKPNYLGSLKEYSNRFMNPITNGQYHDSTERDIKQMKKRSHILNKLLNVYVIQRYGIAELEKYLPKRHDHVLFIELHSVQIQMYTKYIANLENSVMEKNNLFNNFHFLQFICSHPINLLMKEKASIKANLKSNRPTTDSPYLKDVTGLPPNWWNSICPDDYKSNLDYGPKYKVMMAIIRECEAIGDKVLIFSNSMIDLEAIEYFLQQNSTSTSEWKRDLDYFRMDGSVSQSKRAEMCHFFNNPENKRIRLFLLSYRVACLGINLKAANRVILMNVSWNPAIDSQSIFRMYRFGQVKECFVYRLVAMGAMEEVLYERQITKLAVARRVIDETQVSRHYSSTDLQVMYRFNFQTNQPRPMLHISKDAILMKIIEKFPGCVFKYHEHQSLLEDRPDEVLNADDMKSAWEEYYREDEEKTTEQQKKQLKNAPVAGPSGIPNLPSAKVTDQQLKGAPVGGSINAVNNMSTSTPVIRPLNPPTMNNNGPIVNSLQVPNLRPDLNRTLFNNYSMNANNIRANHSYPKGKINPTSFTKTLASQFNNNSSSNINPFSINRQVSNARTINSNVINCDEQNTQSKKPVVLQTLARAIHNRNMQQNAARLEKYPVQPIKISVNQVILSKQEEQHRILSSMHGNSEITISAIGDPRPSTPNTNSNGDSVIQID